MTRTLAIASLLTALAGTPAMAQDVFVGIVAGPSNGETQAGNLPVNTRSIGVEFGAQQKFGNTVFGEASLRFGRGNGGVTGVTELTGTVSGFIGLGAYVTDSFYVSGRIGRVSGGYTNLLTTASETATGNSFGVGFGYDINPDYALNFSADRTNFDAPIGAYETTTLSVSVRRKF